MTISYARATGGWVAFDGEKKLAVLTTQQNQGLFRNGAVVMEPMPRSSWTIHWTSPVLHVELVEAVIASLPTEA